MDKKPNLEFSINFQAPGKKATVFGEGETPTPPKTGWEAQQNESNALMAFFKSLSPEFQARQRKRRRKEIDN